MPYQPAILGTARLNNFRLAYLTADQAFKRPAYIRVILGGVEMTRHVMVNSVRIRDVIFDTPNTCNLQFYGATPIVGQRLEIWVDSNAPVLLFSGELQTVDKTYAKNRFAVTHPCTAIDDTAAANRRRPLGLFTNVSATAIAQTLISTYAPGFSSAGVEANLPAITVNFDGSEAGMKGCLTQIAKLIGGYWYFENKTLYLFQTPPGPPPDPIIDTPGRFLDDPPIKWTIDKSQVRTRVYGKGASTRLAATVDPTVTTIPIDSAVMFNPAGGKAIAAVTPDGAASRVLSYTGVIQTGGGGLVGPGASPSSAPGLALQAGAGVDTGAHGYAVTFTTALGESVASPVASITVGFTAPAATAPTPGSPTSGGAVDIGTHQYGVTFVTASGETNLIAASAPVTITPGPIAPPSPAPTNVAEDGTYSPGWSVGDSITYRVTFVTATGETTPGALSPAVIGSASSENPSLYMKANRVGLAIGPAGVTARRVYRYRNGAIVGYRQVANNTATTYIEYGTIMAPGAGVSPPTTNTTTEGGATVATVPLTAIPKGSAEVTARKLYRYSAAAWRLLDTIANNTATTYTDTKANSALGGAPGGNTATANQVAVTFAAGGSGVTGRKLYRTTAGGAQLKLLATIAENTSTNYLDAIPDVALGALAPSNDTSGLSQPNGQMLPGSTTIIVANTAAFSASGGWAIVGNGEQAIRYTGITANSLTGIPPAGVGSLVASVSYNSTITAAATLTGVSGIQESMLQDSPIHVWVQRDDTAAQAYMVSLDGGGDGIYEHIITDERRSESSLQQACDAQLELYSRPLVSVVYAARDLKTKSGKTITINLESPPISESLTIQDVAISEIGTYYGTRPKFTVSASSVRHSFDSILRMLIRKADS
jgi:hypothetical protein